VSLLFSSQAHPACRLECAGGFYWFVMLWQVEILFELLPISEIAVSFSFVLFIGRK
jgi:hypothetical protein